LIPSHQKAKTMHLAGELRLLFDRIPAFLPALIWSLILFRLSTGPGISAPFNWDQLFQWDKVGHFGGYAIQAYFLLYAFYRIGWAHPAPAIAFSLLFGVAMESIQYAFFPHRFFELADMAANALGTGLGFWIFKKFNH
jgi:hypothetical protein